MVLMGLADALTEIRDNNQIEVAALGENGNKEEIAYLKGGSGMVESVILAIIDTLEGCKKRKEQADANRNPMNKDYLRQMAEVVKSKLPGQFWLPADGRSVRG